MHRIHHIGLVGGLFIATALVGCGAMEQAREAAQRQQMMNNLKQLGIAYHNCHDSTGRGPANWQEAVQYTLPAETQAMLESAGYKVHWGIKIVDAAGGSSLFVLAYPADAASEGGPVLMLDGSVHQMTAQEFSDALAQQKIDSPKAMAAAEAAGNGGGGAPAPIDGAAPPGPPAAPGY
jgi:hypothetical protein